MSEWIMKEEMDMDGVDCFIRKGELIRKVPQAELTQALKDEIQKIISESDQ